MDPVLYSRAVGAAAENNTRPAVYKVIGIVLAVASGLFIGVSFVIKKVGLLQANKKYNQEAGEGYGYLKNWMWWTGMTLMILGEGFNFGAYLFVDAIVVVCLGALSVVTTTILSAIFLKERLSFVGKLGCFNCIVGSVVIVINAPEQSAVANIKEMQHYVIAPGFLSYTGVVVLGSLFTIFWVGPRYGKTSMLVYLSVCSWIGGLSVVAIQGFGAAIVTQIGGTPQFNGWFIYVLLVFVIATLLTEIVYLNKALNLFNAALVTPTYYVYFTTTTIISSAILFRGFKGTGVTIATVIMGFLQICTGVVLLQLAKSSKDVPDTAVFKGDLDQVRTIAEQEEPEFEPRADTIRGSGALLRAISQRRARREAEEARTLYSESMEPINEGESVEWDGLRRRKTVVGSNQQPGSLKRSKTLHPPLGMSRFPDDNDVSDSDSDDIHPGFLPRFGRRSTRKSRRTADRRGPPSPVPMTGIYVSDKDQSTTEQAERSQSREHVYGLPPALRPSHPPEDDDIAYHSSTQHVRWGADPPDSGRAGGLVAPRPPPHGKSASDTNVQSRRAFSFQNVFHRQRTGAESPHLEPLSGPDARPKSRGLSFLGSHNSSMTRINTEEERLGLVQGDTPLDPSTVLDSSPVASPERPLMQSHLERQERGGSNLRIRHSSDDEDWQGVQVPADHRSAGPAVNARDFGVTSASENSAASDSPVVISPVSDPSAGTSGPPPGGYGSRQSPRRGYQRGKYADSDDDDDFSGLGSPRERGGDRP